MIRSTKARGRSRGPVGRWPAAAKYGLKPALRTIAVKPALRTIAVKPALRTIAVKPALRTIAVKPALRTIAVLVCVAVAPSSTWATKILAEAVTLDYQVQNADVIVRGKCESSRTAWVNRHIFTTYQIRVTKYLKTPDKKFAEQNPVLAVTQLGGRVAAPLPLEESYPNRAAIFPGEDVVLFLRSPQSVPASVRARHDEFVKEGRMAPSPMVEDYTLLTLDVSKMTVVREPKAGKELVTRISVAHPDLFGSAEMRKRAVEAFEAGEDRIEVKQGERSAWISVQTGKLVLEPDPAAVPDKVVPTLDQKIERMKAYSATWEEFEAEVQALLSGKKTGAALSVGTRRPSQPE